MSLFSKNIGFSMRLSPYLASVVLAFTLSGCYGCCGDKNSKTVKPGCTRQETSMAEEELVDPASKNRKSLSRDNNGN